MATKIVQSAPSSSLGAVATDFPLVLVIVADKLLNISATLNPQIPQLQDKSDNASETIRSSKVYIMFFKYTKSPRCGSTCV